MQSPAPHEELQAPDSSNAQPDRGQDGWQKSIDLGRWCIVQTS